MVTIKKKPTYVGFNFNGSKNQRRRWTTRAVALIRRVLAVLRFPLTFLRVARVAILASVRLALLVPGALTLLLRRATRAVFFAMLALRLSRIAIAAAFLLASASAALFALTDAIAAIRAVLVIIKRSLTVLSLALVAMRASDFVLVALTFDASFFLRSDAILIMAARISRIEVALVAGFTGRIFLALKTGVSINSNNKKSPDYWAFA